MKKLQCPHTEHKLKVFTVRIPQWQFERLKKRVIQRYSAVERGEFTVTDNFVAGSAFDFAIQYFEKLDEIYGPKKKRSKTNQ